MNKERIAEEAEHFFEWPDLTRKDYVTLVSCLIFAGTIAEMAVAAERERCAKLCDDLSEFYQKHEGLKYPELKTDAQTGADECAYAIRGA